jgi:hypothetical protein
MEMTVVEEGTIAVFDHVIICFALIVDHRRQRLIVDGDFTLLHRKILSSERNHKFAFLYLCFLQ